MTEATSAPSVDRVGPWSAEHLDDAGRAACGWTSVGTRGSGAIARVDRAGLVSPIGSGWSLDWWVGADDRWHLPSAETAVRQGIVDAAPVVETRTRVPGGDIVERVYAAQGPATIDSRPVVVVEHTNETPVPVALAVSVRPQMPSGDGEIHDIVPVEDVGVTVDGAWSVLADRPPRRVAAGGGG
ncbi:MAG: hypothetical protein AAGK32_19400, partial [Actinomycetota bacterium]